MLFNPIYFLARFFVTRMVKKLSLNKPEIFITLLINMSTIVYSLVRTVGLTPVLKALWVIKLAIVSIAALPTNGPRGRKIVFNVDTLFNQIKNIVNGPSTASRGWFTFGVTTVNDFIIRSLVNCIPEQNWIDILLYPMELMKIFNKIIFPCLCFISFSITPIFSRVYKTIIGVILSAFGILFNETLSGIEFLKKFAMYVLDTLDSLSLIDSHKVITGEDGSSTPAIEATPHVEPSAAKLVGGVGC